jgi:TatD DNase family protein
MAIFDSHCHLYWNEDQMSVAEQLQLASEAGVTKLLCVGTDANSSRRCLEISKQHSQVIASVGLHPNDVGDISELESKLDEIAAISQKGDWHAIGETGLDFFHNRSEAVAQETALLCHLGLADHMNLPVIIHCREAAGELVAILEKRGKAVNGVMHCFSEGPEYVTRLLDLGLHFSFAGNISYPKSQSIRDSAACIPLDRLLVETDAPFLAPQPVRGKKNLSAYIVHTLDAVAAARDQSVADIRDQIFNNTTKLFNFVD